MFKTFVKGDYDLQGYGIPEVFESEAKGIVKETFDDIKVVLKVPVVNFVFRALAHYPDFLVLAWESVRANLLTVNMEQAAEHLRQINITAQVPVIDWGHYYDEATLNHIKKVVYVFRYVNPKLLLMLSSWSESLANRPIRGLTTYPQFIKPGIINGLPDIQLVHIPEAPEQVQNLLFNIAKGHRTFDVASDFRALAYYPKFLSTSWPSLKRYVKTAEYDLFSAQLKKQAIQIAHKQMPFSVDMDRGKLEQLYTPAEIAGIFGLVSLFHQFIPGLIIDSEFFWRILN